MSDDFADAVSKALRRAYSLGQTYWQQADSESYSQNRKADDTSRKFAALVDETRALALARSGQAASGSQESARSDVHDGRAAHVAWEAERGKENEIEAERRMRVETRSRDWWSGWFERSDEWRDEIGHDTSDDETDGQNGVEQGATPPAPAARELREAAECALAAYQHRFRSVAPSIGNYPGPIDEEMTALRAALAASPQPAAPEGWVLVPIDPTNEMLAPLTVAFGCGHAEAWLVLSEAIAAAPAAEGGAS